MSKADKKLLFSCARATTSPEVQELQKNLCLEVASWPEVLAEAEQHGIGPLLHLHLHNLGDNCPKEVQRASRLLYLRHRQRNAILLSELEKVATILSSEEIDVLLLKGAALAQTVYADPGLRAMRDIDLLIRPEDGDRAQETLIRNGYQPSTAPRPEDHFHLPALHKITEGIQVCIELHTALFPNCPPYYRAVSFDDLLANSASIEKNGRTYRYFGLEDMLWHVFEHGLRMPLTYEPYKLVAIADLITIIETRLYDINFDRLQHICPQLIAALSYIHHLTPWQDSAIQHLRIQKTPPPKDVGKSFNGWPHLRLAEQRNIPFPMILYRTFLPPRWWSHVYYGQADSRWSFLSIAVCHARQIFWWARLYFQVGDNLQIFKSQSPLTQYLNGILSRFLSVVLKNSL